MRNFFDKKLNPILSAVLVLLIVVAVFQTVFANSVISVGESSAESAISANVNPNYEKIAASADEALSESPTSKPVTETTVEGTTVAESTVAETTASETVAETTAPETTQAQATEAAEGTAAQTIIYQTVIYQTASSQDAASDTDENATQVAAQAAAQAANSDSSDIIWATTASSATVADYNAQWEAGYLVAIDNPDKTYACAQVTLSDEDRDLLERLCMGEFGTGGFIGAALIAQAVKDAICFDGYTSVQEVIDCCHYSGDTNVVASEACKQAVYFVFDLNRDAVQHRIMYMYNPYLVTSAFHESQNYVLTYGQVRFFDRWNY